MNGTAEVDLVVDAFAAADHDDPGVGWYLDSSFAEDVLVHLIDHSVSFLVDELILVVGHPSKAFR